MLATTPLRGRTIFGVDTTAIVCLSRGLTNAIPLKCRLADSTLGTTQTTLTQTDTSRASNLKTATTQGALARICTVFQTDLVRACVETSQTIFAAVERVTIFPHRASPWTFRDTELTTVKAAAFEVRATILPTCFWHTSSNSRVA